MCTSNTLPTIRRRNAYYIILIILSIILYNGCKTTLFITIASGLGFIMDIILYPRLGF